MNIVVKLLVAVQRKLEAIVRARKDRAISRAFAAGFERFPETDEELRSAAKLAIASIEDEPWEKWW